MAEDSTVVIRAPASVRTPLPGGTELIRKPMDAQAFYHIVALHGSLWGHTDLGSSSGSSIPEPMTLGMDLSGPCVEWVMINPILQVCCEN